MKCGNMQGRRKSPTTISDCAPKEWLSMWIGPNLTAISPAPTPTPSLIPV